MAFLTPLLPSRAPHPASLPTRSPPTCHTEPETDTRHPIPPSKARLHIPEKDDEHIFDGLSYPPDKLDWCLTASYANPSSIPASLPTSVPDPKTRICEDDPSSDTQRVEREFVDTFRMSSPYIHAHQGLIFVLHVPGALLNEPLFASVMEDIALMRVVGIKLVLVLGPQMLVDDRLAQSGISSIFVAGQRVTDAATLQIVKEVAGNMRFEVEGKLAKGVKNMPSQSRIQVVSGAFFSAKPLGVINGEDYGYTGKIRSIDAQSIHSRLDQGDIVVIPNVGCSPSGQYFNCKSEDVAAACAAELGAEKLIFMSGGETLYDRRGDYTIANLTLKSAATFLEKRAEELPNTFRSALESSVQALKKGVRRAHILNRFMNGVLLMEVFHRDGVGLMISRDLYEGFRPARLSDLDALFEIIRPLEDKGILKPRARTVLESDIEKFLVIERDGMIIACMSLEVVEDERTWAELGCLAVHTDYRKLGKGGAMLEFTERMAFKMGVRNLYILSTQSFDWFRERGFVEAGVDDLPASRQMRYDRTRRSKIFHKQLEANRSVFVGRVE